MNAVKTYETQDYRYEVTYTRVCKTSYEERQERKLNRKYFAIQKLIGVAAICLGLLLIALQGGITPLVIIPLGIYLTVTKQHVITI